MYDDGAKRVPIPVEKKNVKTLIVLVLRRLLMNMYNYRLVVKAININSPQVVF